MNDTNQVEQKLAGSLTAETTELIPYLPYLLQDIWELGSSPRDMVRLIKNNIDICGETKVIDLGCGKGAVSIALCRELGIRVCGIDLLPDFIREAKAKALEEGVSHLCEFQVQDINESVKSRQDYDIAILGAVGDVLGNPAETLAKLKQVVRRGGYILIEEAYLVGDPDDVRYQNYDYLPLNRWEALFRELGFVKIMGLTAEDTSELKEVNDYNNRMIKQRAEELMKKHPEKRAIFEGYVTSQEMECDDLYDVINGITWLLRRSD